MTLKEFIEASKIKTVALIYKDELETNTNRLLLVKESGENLIAYILGDNKDIKLINIQSVGEDYNKPIKGAIESFFSREDTEYLYEYVDTVDELYYTIEK